MSRSYEVSYEMERARREAEFKRRVSTTTEKFYNRYVEQYEEMQRKGYEIYIPDEMRRLGSDLEQIRRLLTIDPVEARDISQGVGSYIYSMHGLARAAEEQFLRQERMRQEELRIEREKRKTAVENHYFTLLQKIESPIVAGFAQDRLSALRSRLGSMSEAQVEAEVSSIVSEAQTKARAWKEQTTKAQSTEALQARLKDVADQISNEKIENEEAKNEIQNRLKKLREQMSMGQTTIEEANREVAEISDAVDDVMITEAQRRETVKAIIKQLRAQEFTVSPPTLEGEHVKIMASKPSGKRVSCMLDLHGKLRYRFDKYEGMTCLKDIEQFNVDLDKVYSIKLSDERILWSNPDRLMVDADRMPQNRDRHV